ncbi:hypothetical protein Tco_0896877, partial [Tanacetum coccineum]
SIKAWDQQSQNNSLAKLPILKLGEYEMWEIRIKQYFQIQDYALWEVIEYGNSHDDCSFQDDGIDDHQVNTASPQVNTGSRVISTAAPQVNTGSRVISTAAPQVNTGSRVISTAAPEVNTATSEGLM